MKQVITAYKIVTCTLTIQWIVFSTCCIHFIYFYYMPYFEHQSALKEQEPVSESLRVPWMKLGAQLCPHPKLLFIPHKGLQKGLTHGLYHLSKRTAIEVSGREEPKVVLRTLGNYQSQNTHPNSCPQSEHPYCNNLCLHSILKITCSFDPVKNSGREGGEM